jgi:transcriptional regulator of acetoin/glycerol metabolism
MTRPSGPLHWTRRKSEQIRRGADSHAARLTREDIAQVYQFADRGWLPSQIAAHFGVSRQTIWRQLRDRYTHNVVT